MFMFYFSGGDVIRVIRTCPIQISKIMGGVQRADIRISALPNLDGAKRSCMSAVRRSCIFTWHILKPLLSLLI